jgi:hypothetical protein
MTRRGIKGYAVKTRAESARRRLARLAKQAREKKGTAQLKAKANV